MSELFDSFGSVITMAKKAILGGMGLSLRDGLRNSMNIFLNELYRLKDSREGLRALSEKRASHNCLREKSPKLHGSSRVVELRAWEMEARQ